MMGKGHPQKQATCTEESKGPKPLSRLHIRVISQLSEITAGDWDRCLGKSGSPFLRYSFLSGLELCGCVGPQTGWLPRYLICADEEKTLGVIPAYVKSHSQGEFIFDWSWADAAHRAGMPYYPKLVVTAPFSPVGSEKILIDPELSLNEREEVRRSLIKGLRALCHRDALTGLHLLFVSSLESDQLEREGFIPRHTLQFQWENEGYRDFDDFLMRFRSKRRNQIRRERRRVREAGIDVKVFFGDEVIEAHIPIIYRFYRSTVEKYFYGNLYLNEAFFRHLFETQRESLCLLLAYQGDRVIGGSFNLVHHGVLYGRYWGIDPEIDAEFLHFEVCAYQGIEICIERGWSRFEAGSGGGAHKYGRGFLPQLIYSAHEVYLPGFDLALRDLLQHERAALDDQLSHIEGEVLKLPVARDDT